MEFFRTFRHAKKTFQTSQRGMLGIGTKELMDQMIRGATVSKN